MPKYLTTLGLIIGCGILLLTKSSFLISGNGFFDFLVGDFYRPVIIGFTIVALIFHTGPKWNPKPFFLNLGIGLLAILIFSLFMNKETFSKIDWKINKQKRERIVELVKNGKIKNEKIPDSLTLSLNCSPNEFRIQKKTDSTVTILFYTDFGLLDHYSGFVYSNNPLDLTRLNRNVLDGGNDYKINENWFEIND